MASLFPDLENDIFISYRQNDNKYDGWVTEFVANLSRELEATVKEKINVYFDENPRDGLLETHNVDKSLANRLKSLIFIPVLSQTYCDTKCYAWQNEFLAFNKLAREDRFGREIRLRNGNVASRILPVRIHELDPGDLKLIQEEIGGPLRAIDFFFREPGVNRPLRPQDQEDRNFSKTIYRNQVNKIANSVRDMIYSLRDQVSTDRGIPNDIKPSPVSSDKSIAVLPFVNMSNDPEQEYFSDGISEEIINTLVQVPELKVAGRTSAFSFKNKNEDLRSIGEKLNVNTILEGSVRKSGNRIRVTAQLIEASTGFHLWSQKFDRELNDVFIIQDEIAGSIVNNLQITLAGKPVKPKERPQTQNVEAYQLYLKGMSLFYKRGLHIIDGLKCFEEALNLDPEYALALTGLADSYTMLCLHGYIPPEEAWPRAIKAAKHAIQAEPDLAEAHNAQGIIALFFEHNGEKAETAFVKALELKPGFLQARCWYGLFYLRDFKHNSREALRHARIAVEFDPLSSYAQSILCLTATDAGLFNEAIEPGQKSIEFDRESFLAWYTMAYCHQTFGNFSKAIEEYKYAINISGRHCWAVAGLLCILAQPSEYQHKEEAEFLYRELITRSRTGYVPPMILAIAAANLCKNEAAVSFIKEGLERHDPYFIQLASNGASNKAVFNIPGISELLKSIGIESNPNLYNL